MFRKLLLLICMGLLAVIYVYPCFMLPFGSYSGTFGSEENEHKVEITMEFDWNGKVKFKQGDFEQEMYYKLDGDSVIISLDKIFDETDEKMKLNNLYEFDYITELRNDIGMYMTIGVGALMLILILWPSRRR